MANNLISIIVPIYNIEQYLEKCIGSICAQTYKNIEIILVDDGSTDKCPDICDKFKAEDSRVRVIHKENEGLVRARKTGLLYAKGDYIAYVDGDDWVEKEMFAHLFKIIDDNGVDIAMCGYFEDTGNITKRVVHNVKSGKYDKTSMKKEIYPIMMGSGFYRWEILPHVWGKLFCRERLMEIQMQLDDSITMGEDAACTYPCILLADSIYVTEECLYHYRQSTNSMIKIVSDPQKERERFGALYKTFNNLFEKYAYIYDMRELFKRYMLFLLIPRADNLYSGFDGLDYLFPFTNIKKGMDIVLCCAGTYGQRLYTYLKKTQFCNIAAWVDGNYESLQSMGLPVESPDVISLKKYDAIVIANMFDESRKFLYKDLSRKYGKEKVYQIDENIIFSEDTWNTFGLGEI